ncbi:MAG: RDD family protein [Pseudomonadota bacterium]
MAWFRKNKSGDAGGKSKVSDKQMARLAKKAAKRERRQLVIMPPEGVPLTLVPAGLGGRLGAQLLDLFFTLLIGMVLIFAAFYAFQGLRASSAIIIVLTFFLLRLPYYIVTEIIWNGQTPAKRILGLRTVSVNGKGLTIYQIVVRNLLREIEFFSPVTYLLAGASDPGILTLIAALWTVVVIIVPLWNRWNQRIGDILADTAVINTPKPALLPDVAIAKPSGALSANSRSSENPLGRWRDRSSGGSAQEPVYTFSRAQLDHYGRHELQVLETVLRTDPGQSDKLQQERRANLGRIARQIGKKIGYGNLISDREANDFLAAFYRAERAYLEERNLMGDRRDDKNYR